MLSTEELNRYSRHIILPGFGKQGQEKLKQAKVLVVGAGGLGCPALQYLAASGIGTIGIIDDDRVAESNLQRQILFSTADIGKFKAEVAAEKLRQQNPYIHVLTYNEALTNQNALEIINDYDVLLDGSDNFMTRYLVNDACVILNKPFVFGSIFKFEGQVTVFNYKQGATYRCLYPEPPLPDEVPNCAEIGVIGVLPGMVGTIQAAEVIKILAETGKVASGKLLIFDALNFDYKTINIPRSEDAGNINALGDYASFCGAEYHDTIKEIDVFGLKQKIDNKEDFLILDVRNPNEYTLGNIGGYNAPLKDIDRYIDQIPRDKEIVVHCHHGSRSKKAIQYLNEQYQYSNLVNLKGGIHQWSLYIDSNVPVYT